MKLSKQEREALILASKPIVKNVVRRYRLPADRIENLLQEGYKALCEAVDSYKEDSKHSLTSHIYYYVRKQVFLSHKRDVSCECAEFLEEEYTEDRDTSLGGRSGAIEHMLASISRIRRPGYKKLFEAFLKGDKSVTIKKLGTPIQYLREAMGVVS